MIVMMMRILTMVMTTIMWTRRMKMKIKTRPRLED